MIYLVLCKINVIHIYYDSQFLKAIQDKDWIKTWTLIETVKIDSSSIAGKSCTAIDCELHQIKGRLKQKRLQLIVSFRLKVAQTFSKRGELSQASSGQNRGGKFPGFF